MWILIVLPSFSTTSCRIWSLFGALQEFFEWNMFFPKHFLNTWASGFPLLRCRGSWTPPPGPLPPSTPPRPEPASCRHRRRPPSAGAGSRTPPGATGATREHLLGYRAISGYIFSTSQGDESVFLDILLGAGPIFIFPCTVFGIWNGKTLSQKGCEREKTVNIMVHWFVKNTISHATDQWRNS